MSVHAAMAEVAKAVGSIAKQSSSGVTYKFRGIDAVMDALHKPLADNGLFLAPRVLDDWQLNMIAGTNNRTQSQALFRVAVDVYHKDGSMVTLGPGLAQSHDYGDKAVYQASQNAIKYLLLNAFSIPTGDVDMDAVQADEVPAAPALTAAEKLERAINQAKKDLADRIGDLETAKQVWKEAIELADLASEDDITNQTKLKAVIQVTTTLAPADDPERPFE